MNIKTNSGFYSKSTGRRVKKLQVGVWTIQAMRGKGITIDLTRAFGKGGHIVAINIPLKELEKAVKANYEEV